MAYYDALIAKWATAPAGTTDQKLTWINAEVITGQIPTSFYTTGDALLNCIDYAEFKALTPVDKQANVLRMCGIGGQLLGGSAQVSHMVAGMIVDYFGTSGKTITALTALAKATVIPWWQATVAQGGGGLSSPVSHSDLDAAGLS
jgi:hypothetical protein